MCVCVCVWVGVDGWVHTEYILPYPACSCLQLQALPVWDKGYAFGIIDLLDAGKFVAEDGALCSSYFLSIAIMSSVDENYYKCISLETY